MVDGPWAVCGSIVLINGRKSGNGSWKSNQLQLVQEPTSRVSVCVYMAKLAYTLVGTDSKRSRETDRGAAVSWLRDMIHTPSGHQCPVDAAQQYKGAVWISFSQIILVYSHYFCIVVLLLHISSRHSFHASRQNHQIIKDESLGPLQLLHKKYQHLAACYLICMQLPFCSSISRASRSQK